jgi:protein TonB
MLEKLTWPGPLAEMDPPQRNFTLALGVSLFLHAILLSIHFKLPDALGKATEQALDVILVNSKSANRPTGAQAKAQANLDGGGNTDEDRRLKTPLPMSKATREGNDVVETQRRVSELESRTREMMTQAKSDRSVSADARRNDPALPAPNVSGLDLAASAMAIARLQGQIDKNFDEYNKRPRKKFIGARAEEYRFAQYVEDWRQKVERVGNLNYPEAAKGRHYGNLVLTVIIRNDGELERVEINRSSGKRVLDDAAKRIVEMAAPYPAFPEAIRRDTDILEITRTWTFTSSDRLRSD